MKNVTRRLAARGDPWADIATERKADVREASQLKRAVEEDRVSHDLMFERVELT